MAQDVILTSDTVKDALTTKINGDLTELYATQTEVQNARDGQANLLAKIDQIDTAVAASAAGSGVVISANDTTQGFVNGKLVAGTNVTFTENNDGADETLTIAVPYVAKSVTAKIANYPVVAADLRGITTFTNSAAVGEINFTLPAGVAGYEVAFEVMAAQYLKVTANGAETFRFLANQSAGGGYIRSNTVGTAWKIRFNGTEWVITNLTGVLRYDE